MMRRFFTLAVILLALLLVIELWQTSPVFDQTRFPKNYQHANTLYTDSNATISADLTFTGTMDISGGSLSMAGTGWASAQHLHTAANRGGTLSHDSATDNPTSATHGLPSGAYVLGNKGAAGEYFQRGSVDPAALSASDLPMYGQDVAVTFPVAFSSTPFVMFGGTSVVNALLGGANSITTTGFTMTIFGQTASQDFNNVRWTALGG